MKFIRVIIIINVVLFVLLLFSFLFSSIIGSDIGKLFQGNNLILVFVLIATVILLNFILFNNKSTFDFIENKDWTGLNGFFYKRIFIKKRLNVGNVELYIKSCFFLNDTEKILELKEFLQERNKALLVRFSPEISMYYMTNYENGVDEISKYCDEIIIISKSMNKKVNDWIVFEKYFSMLMAFPEYAKKDNIKIDKVEHLVKSSFKELSYEKREEILREFFSTLKTIKDTNSENKKLDKDVEKIVNEIIEIGHTKNENTLNLILDYLIKSIGDRSIIFFAILFNSILIEILKELELKTNENLIGMICLYLLNNNFSYNKSYLENRVNFYKENIKPGSFEKYLNKEKEKIQVCMFLDIIENSAKYIYQS